MLAHGRRFPIGAEVVGDGQVSFRVWAPAASRVQVVLSDRDSSRHALEPEANGYFSGVVRARAGDRYRFRLDDSAPLYPDPASRFQPCGPHQASAVVDSTSYDWGDASWSGVPLEGQVIYELHPGTFTREGTWSSAQCQLDELARVGITVIELMPVAEFEGRFGWGYDGVDLFAPSHLYGRPDDLRRFIDAAHARAIGVLLDVVYNHFGPSGNYLRAFSPAYFTDTHENEWGDAINFDGPDSEPVREFFITNAAYWIDEFHFDGLRLDATQQIFDASQPHIITEVADAARRRATHRRVLLVGENESHFPAFVTSWRGRRSTIQETKRHSSAASWISLSARRITRGTRSIRTCCSYGVTSLRSGRSDAVRWTVPCWLRRRSCSVSLLTRRQTSAC